jgi:hypothetical protein
LSETRRARVDNHTNDQCTENVEEEDTEESRLDGAGNSLARVLGFTDYDSDELGAHVGEQGENESVDETEELAEIACLLVGLESLAVTPVTETETFLTGNTSEVDNEAEEDETSEGNDLDQGKPESTISGVLSHKKLTQSLRTT